MRKKFYKILDLEKKYQKKILYKSYYSKKKS